MLNFLNFIVETAKAAPNACCEVVLAVGTIPPASITFGLLSFNSSLFYNLISGIIGAVIIFLIIIGIKSDKFDKITFSIIIGGAVGIFYDRIVFKAVPDFIDLHYMDFHWFTFNVADIFISIGIISFLAKDFFIKKEV